MAGEQVDGDAGDVDGEKVVEDVGSQLFHFGEDGRVEMNAGLRVGFLHVVRNFARVHDPGVVGQDDGRDGVRGSGLMRRQTTGLVMFFCWSFTARFYKRATVGELTAVEPWV